MSENDTQAEVEVPVREENEEQTAEEQEAVVDEDRAEKRAVVKEEERGQRRRICQSIYRHLLRSGLSAEALDEVHQKVVAELGEN